MNQAQEKTLQLAQHAQETYLHTVDAGVPLDDVLKPEYWAHVAAKFRPLTVIRVTPEDGSFYAELLVVSCDRLWAKVHPLSFHDLTSAGANPEATAKAADGFSIEWKGPIKKHCVIRKSDGVFVADGIQKMAEAQVWLDGHIKTTLG